MDDNTVKTFVVCNTENSFDNFYFKYRECKQCKNKRVLKRFYDNKVKILQQRWDKYACFKDLDNRLKALEQKLGVTYELT